MTTHAKASGWLDAIPAWARHLVLIMLVPALTALASTAQRHDLLVDWGNVATTAVAAGATYLLLLITPLTRQYGVGAPPPPGEPVIAPPGG